MELIKQTGSNLSSVIVSNETAEILKSSLSKNTKAAYRSDLKQFAAWLASAGHTDTLPYQPGTVADYITHLDKIGRAMATIRRQLRALSLASLCQRI